MLLSDHRHFPKPSLSLALRDGLILLVDNAGPLYVIVLSISRNHESVLLFGNVLVVYNIYFIFTEF